MNPFRVDVGMQRRQRLGASHCEQQESNRSMKPGSDDRSQKDRLSGEGFTIAVLNNSSHRSEKLVSSLAVLNTSWRP
jgi:hypothetical protein